MKKFIGVCNIFSNFCIRKIFAGFIFFIFVLFFPRSSVRRILCALFLFAIHLNTIQNGLVDSDSAFGASEASEHGAREV